ncbi:MAG: STAS domain-containing protein [Anaerolineae bacterium]
MDYQIYTEGPVRVVELSGDLDVAGAPTFQDALQEIIDSGGQHVVVDLGAVPFMDSSGLGVLVAAHRRMSAVGGRLALAEPGPALQKVFQLTRTNRLFEMHDTVSEAIAEMRDA